MSSTDDPIKRFLAQIDRLDEANGKSAPPEQVARYAQELMRAGITPDQLTLAVDDLVLNSKFFPKIPEIMQVIAEQVTGAVPDPQACRLWIETARREAKYAAEASYYDTDVLERGVEPPEPPVPGRYPDPVTKAVVHLMTWRRLLDYDFDDPYRWAEFTKTYQQAHSAVQRLVRTGSLPAISPTGLGLDHGDLFAGDMKALPS